MQGAATHPSFVAGSGSLLTDWHVKDATKAQFFNAK